MPADAEGDGVVADRSQVFLLAQRFGVDRAAFGRHGDKIIGQLPQALFLALFGEVDAVAHRLLIQRGAVFHQRDHALDRMDRRCDACFLAAELERRAAADRRDPEFAFQKAHVLIAVAEDLHRPLCQMHTPLSSAGPLSFCEMDKIHPDSLHSFGILYLVCIIADIPAHFKQKKAVLRPFGKPGFNAASPFPLPNKRKKQSSGKKEGRPAACPLLVFLIFCTACLTGTS